MCGVYNYPVYHSTLSEYTIYMGRPFTYTVITNTLATRTQVYMYVQEYTNMKYQTVTITNSSYILYGVKSGTYHATSIQYTIIECLMFVNIQNLETAFNKLTLLSISVKSGLSDWVWALQRSTSAMNWNLPAPSPSS